MALKSAQETISRYIRGRKILFQMRLRSVIFPHNSLYAQAVAYTTYFGLGERVDKRKFKGPNFPQVGTTTITVIYCNLWMSNSKE